MLKKLKKKYKLSVLAILLIEIMILLHVYDSDYFCKDYYGVYSTQMFNGLFLMCFFIGIIPIFRYVYVHELIVRQGNSAIYIYKYIKKVCIYSLVYGSNISIVTVLMIIFGVDFDIKWLGICLLNFIGQSIGWVLVGMLTLCLYIASKNIIISIVLNWIGIILGNELISDWLMIDKLKYYFSIPEMMFYSYESTNAYIILGIYSYYIILIWGLIKLSVYIFKKTDKISRVAV